MGRSKFSEVTEQFNNKNQFSSWIKRFADGLEARELILLSGDLGAGKTYFVTELVKSLGGRQAASPSFAIHNHYKTPKHEIDHLDLYRLESIEDLESTGFWDLFAKESGVIVVEWADKLNSEELSLLWPIWEIKIEYLNEDRQSEKRRVRVSRLLA